MGTKEPTRHSSNIRWYPSVHEIMRVLSSHTRSKLQYVLKIYYNFTYVTQCSYTCTMKSLNVIFYIQIINDHIYDFIFIPQTHVDGGSE